MGKVLVTVALSSWLAAGCALADVGVVPLDARGQRNVAILAGQLSDATRTAKTKLEAAQQLLGVQHPRATQVLVEFLGRSDNRPAQIAVAEAIATHRYRADAVPQSLEARVLYDADKLDAIGAIGIARAYAIAGIEGQRLWGRVPDGYGERGRTEGRSDVLGGEHTPVHEFVFKLSRLKGTLFTETARRIAEERHVYMVGFFERLGREVAGEV